MIKAQCPHRRLPADGMASNTRAFSLVELIIVIAVLAILAAMVLPKFTSAGTEAKGSNAATQLRMAREALLRYEMDHNEELPALGEMWTNLTSRTDFDGTVNASGDFGPYLPKPPINPFTNSSSVVASGAGTATDGWEYDTTTSPYIWAVGFDEATQTYTAP